MKLFKPGSVVTDSLGPVHEISLAKVESEAAHLERVRLLFEERKEEMKKQGKYLCDAAKFVRRLDGRDAVYKPSARQDSNCSDIEDAKVARIRSKSKARAA